MTHVGDLRVCDATMAALRAAYTWELDAEDWDCCPGWIVSTSDRWGTHVERCDDCKRYTDDAVALDAALAALRKAVLYSEDYHAQLAREDDY